MKQNVIDFLRLLVVAVLFWSLAFCFLIFVRYYALNEERGITIASGYNASISQLIKFGLFLGVFVGIFYAFIEVLFDKFLLKKLYLGLSILIRTVVYLVLLISSLTILMEIAELLWGFELENERGWWRTNKVFWLIVSYFGIFSLIFSFLKIVRERFGRGVFLKLLVGKYRKPIEEERVFMFLDLKSSTTIAENLGHLTYSKLLQDCFLDLNMILKKFRAEVYQYVGDEAVLSWSFKSAIKRNNCLALFFAFQERILKRAAYYQNNYQLVPEFKAGLHGGKLIVVEVGSVKKELAYHGDVINTTSRIQDQCNSHGEKLLISEELVSLLTLGLNYKTKEIGNLMLKGKNTSLTLYAIAKA